MMQNFFGNSLFGNGFFDDFFSPMPSLFGRMNRMLEDPFDDFFAEMPALSAAPAQQQEASEEKKDDLVGKEEQSRFSYLRQMNALKMELKKAVHQENFERAAELRDQIRSLEAAHKEQKEQQVSGTFPTKGRQILMNENKFSPGAEEALRLAQEAAGELGHGYVGTEHLLLGLIREEEGVAHAVLTEAGLTDDMIVEIIKSQRGGRPARRQPRPGPDAQGQAGCGAGHGGLHAGRLQLRGHGAPAGRYPAGGQQHGRPHPAGRRCGCPAAVHGPDAEAQ